MKLRLLIIPALMAMTLLAQGPGASAPPPPPGPFGRGPSGVGPFGMGPDGMGPGGGWRDHGGRMGMHGQGRGMREFGLDRLLSDPNVRQQLGVTADQAAKIRQQESDFRKAEIRNRADLQIKRMDLNDLLSADKPDRSAIDSKLQEVGAAQVALEKSDIDHRLNMRDALTPIQRQKLEQMMMQRRRPAPGGTAVPQGPQGAGRGGRGAVPPANPQGQAPRN